MSLRGAVKGVVGWFQNSTKAEKLALVHLSLAILWTLLIVPTLIWWKESILWVALMSVYAIIGTHVASYQAARGERKQDETNGNGSSQ